MDGNFTSNPSRESAQYLEDKRVAACVCRLRASRQWMNVDAGPPSATILSGG